MNPAPGPHWSGRVVKVTDDYIYLNLDKPDPTSGKKRVKVGLFGNYPLNQESFIHNTPTVKPGDRVTPNKFMAESNFTKNGVLALGANVNVAYMPWKGLTYEDSAVVSESFAKKFTSEKIVKRNIFLNNKLDVLDLSKFRAIFPDALTPENAKKLDETGIVKPGQIIQPGELLAAYLSKVDLTEEEKILRQMNRGIAKPFKKRILEWDDDYPGEVLYVSKVGRNIDIHLKVRSPLIVGDKIAGNFGNKAIVSQIVPDDEMPHTKQGERMDVIFSPVTVPGRMNIGQLVEAAVGKLIHKTNKKPRIIDNFIDSDQLTKAAEELKKHNIPIEETLLDGKDGKPFEKPIFWGRPYIMKLRHVVEHKLKSRNIGQYDINMQPSRGKESGQTMGSMEVMAMLGWGARSNLWEATALKGQQNDEYWRALQLGLPTPPPKANFAFEKMLAYLKQAGVNVEKEGDKFTLMPLTDKEVKKISSGKVTDAGQMLIAKNLKAIKGGLFDPEIFGGANGKKWGHIELATKIPNPIMEGAITKLLDLTVPEFEAIISYKKELNGKTGFKAIEDALSKIDIDKELLRLKRELETAPEQKINVINKKIRYLSALKRFGLKPTDYLIKKVPVLPPIYRPIYPLPSGDLMVSPINKHYRDVSLINESVKKVKQAGLPDEFNVKNEITLYKAVKALQGLSEPVTYTQEKYEGALKTLAGSSPKYGFIHDKLFSKKQDMSARSTVGLDPSLGIDEAGLPDDMVKNLYKPFIIKHLIQSGLKATQAVKEVRDWTPLADRTLDIVIKERPVLLNRAPTLHKHGIQAFKVKRIAGKTIKTNPLISGGFNLDFNGDSVAEETVIYAKIGNKSFVGPVGQFVKEILLPGTSNNDLLDLAEGKTLVLGINELYVLGTSPNNHVKFMKANNVSIHTSHGPCYELTIRHNLPFICTEHHNISYVDMQSFETKAIKTENLKKGTIIPLVRKIKIDETKVPKTMEIKDPSGKKWDKRVKINKIFELNFSSGFFLGYWFGDGSVTGSSGMDMGIACTKKEIFPLLREAFHKTFGIKSGVVLTDKRYPDGSQIRFYASPLARWLKYHFGYGALNKQFPDWYLETPEEFRKGLIAGLMESDGCITYNTINKNIIMNIQVISKKGIIQVQTLFRSLGIQTSLSELKRKTKTNNNTVYLLQINPSQLDEVPLHKDGLKFERYKKLRKKFPKQRTRDTHDLVPYSKAIHEELCKYKEKYAGKCRRNKKLQAELEAYRAKFTDVDTSTPVDPRSIKNKNLISRLIAKRLIATKYVYLQKDRSELMEKWLEMVNNEYIKYDVIKSVRRVRRPDITYDFSLPENETFVIDGGIITHNTMAVHVPIGTEAVNEA
jgi:intein/homing endonuclease